MKNHSQTNEPHMMKIGQLSARSGVSRSSIHHYLNIGLLPKPVPAGLNIHLYSQDHLAILREIKRLRDEENVSLNEIKERLQKTDLTSLAKALINKNNDDPQSAGSSAASRKLNPLKREQIIEKATDLFSRIGYEAVRISDITDALRMSKATFYEYFQGKEQLFIECIERLVVEIVPREGWQSIREEKDYFKRQILRARQFLNSFPGYSGILQQARFLSRADNLEMAAKAKNTFHIMTRPLKRDIENALARSMIRSFDPELGAHILLGIVEGLGWKMMVDPSVDIEQVLNTIFDLLKHGLSPNRTVDDNGSAENQEAARIIDIRGVETVVDHIRFNGNEQLEAKKGEALVNINIRGIRTLQISESTNEAVELIIASHESQALTVSVTLGMRINGRTPFGDFSIPIEKISLVEFEKLNEHKS